MASILARKLQPRLTGIKLGYLSAALITIISAASIWRLSLGLSRRRKTSASGENEKRGAESRSYLPALGCGGMAAGCGSALA